MAHQITIPFFAFKLHFHSGGTILSPLSDQQVFRLGEPLYLLAGKYAEQLQRKVINKGKIRQLLNEYAEGDFIKGHLVIHMPKAKDGYSHPEFDLVYDYYFNEQDNGFWGILPALGVEAFAHDAAALYKRLEEAVKLDFARKNRVTAVQDIVSTMWYDLVELNREEMMLDVPSPKELDKLQEQKQEPLLPQLATPLQLTKQVVYGRKKELDQFSKTIKGDFIKNVLLVGPSGVGKTALVWELARQRKKKKLKGDIWETTASALIKELMRDTGWQDNLSYLCKELANGKDILFIRNLMELFEVGKYEGNSVSIADYLRTFISRGEITIISECTEEEMARIELQSPNYLSFFQVIRLEKPTDDLEEIILKKVRDIANKKHLKIDSDAIQEVLRLNNRYTPYSGLPGKPIRFLESILINSKNKEEQVNIERSEVIRYFCEDTGMPVFMVDPAIPMNANEIKAQFNNNVFGQENAVESVVNLLASVKTALTQTGKPIASLLFVGPTGVGKTELAKVLAEFIFGNRNRMIRFDMSEYSDPYSVSRLVGSSYFSDGLLTSAVRKEPFAVLLFDEIEKADSTFYDLLLQVLSEGRLTDSQGKLVNFCSTIIIMTSNIGAKSLNDRIINLTAKQDKQQIVDHFMTAVQNYFRPELFNRIDQVIPFEPLDQLTVRYVVDREIVLLRKREGIQFRRMHLSISDAVYDFLAEKGYQSKYGARQLQRTIREFLIVPLAKALNAEDYDDQLVVNIDIEEDQVAVRVEADPLGLELLIEELDKINQADHASTLRRHIGRLKAGHFFVRLQNELDLMERQKNKKRSKFWKDQKNAERYAYYLDTLNNVEELTKRIDKQEMNLSLACLNLIPYETKFAETLKQWEEDFFRLKVEIYTRLNPKDNTCFFSIYGSGFDEILKFYLKLFEEKNFELTAKSIWFREAYYNEEIEKMDGDDELFKTKREEYLKEDVALEKIHNLKAPKSGDKLCGIEFTVYGECAYLFLRDESGVQKWKRPNSEQKHFAIIAANHAFRTPIEIHRKGFYTKQTPKRYIEDNIIRDNSLGLKREFNKNDLVPLLLELLEKQFEQKLNTQLF